MKIIYEEKPVKSFYELESGTVFIYDNVAYIKIDEVKSEDKVTGEYLTFNAIFPGDGEPVHFDRVDKVQVCSDAVLMIK